MESNFKLVSVVIPTYGRGDELRGAIDSVLKQSYLNVEVIVVDDNKSLENISKVKKIVGEYFNEKVKYIGDGINRGGSGARNFGLENSNGTYIGFLDDDDVFEPDKITKQVVHIEKNNLDVSVCNMYFEENCELKDITRCYARVHSLKEFIINGNFYTPMILAKKEVLTSVGGFTITPRFQDHLLMLKILGFGVKVGHLNEKLFTHRNHKGPRVTFSSKSIEGFENRFIEESKYLVLLNECELKNYLFKKNLTKMKIFRAKGQFKDLMKVSLHSFINVRSPLQLYMFLKCVFRTVFMPSKPF